MSTRSTAAKNNQALNTISLGDCRDMMKEMDANLFGCVVTDPPYGLSFMGKDWDHGVPGKEFWEIALRVMKPGAFLLSFGGTRTFHRLTCAIEDAGFEIRDCMMWLYGSGFPKSHDVSKAIDKAAGAEREIERRFKNGDMRGPQNFGNHNQSGKKVECNITAPSTDAAKQWSGWGTALKPAWEPIIVARKPLEGTVAENVLKWGTGGMNIDGGRIEIVGDRRSPCGADGTVHRTTGNAYSEATTGETFDLTKGRWPANVILDEEAGAMLDGQTEGKIHGAGHARDGSSAIVADHYAASSYEMQPNRNMRRLGDTGGASRFFYCAKASKRERGEGNTHPTVKPLSLLQYLIKLICPNGGVVLDPFVGSGSTALAAQNLGFDFMGIEKEPLYVEIALARLAAAKPFFAELKNYQPTRDKRK